MANIFISYNRKNHSIADTLSTDLQALGHTTWLDQELSGGQRWWDEILNRIRQCDIFVFVLDRESLSSVACSSEYNYADALGKPILPIRVSPDVSDSSLPAVLSVIQYVDYSEHDRSAAFELSRALGAIKPAPTLPDPLPEPPEVPLSYLGKLAPLVNSASELSRAQQADLVFQLKDGLKDPDTAQETCKLLEQLRRRSDLYAKVAKDIDDLLQTSHTSLKNPAEMKTTPPPQQPLQIPNYLVWTIVSAFCCLPVAIPAIIFSAQVNSKIAAGDFAGAMASSKNARTFATIGVVVGLLVTGVYLISMLFLGAMQQPSGYYTY